MFIELNFTYAYQNSTKSVKKVFFKGVNRPKRALVADLDSSASVMLWHFPYIFQLPVSLSQVDDGNYTVY